MKITLDISREELRKMIGESDTFFLAYNSDRLQIVDDNNTPDYSEIERDLINNLKGKPDLVSRVKFVRCETKYYEYIEAYCKKKGINFVLSGGGGTTLGLGTAKEFVERLERFFI